MRPREHWVDTANNMSCNQGYNALNFEIPEILRETIWEQDYMDASAINRKLKELDALEKRLRQTVNPSQILLTQINKERNELLNPKETK